MLIMELALAILRCIQVGKKPVFPSRRANRFSSACKPQHKRYSLSVLQGGAGEKWLFSVTGTRIYAKEVPLISDGTRCRRDFADPQFVKINCTKR